MLIPAADRPRPTNDDAIELVEGALERLRSGEVVAVAVVEVIHDGSVATHYSAGTGHHHLTAGAARLLARLSTN